MPLVEHPGDDLFAVWEPDGRGVLFSSDRSGTVELWRIGFEEARPAGAAARVRGGLGPFVPMGITRSGTLFYGLRSGRTDVFVAAFDPAQGRVLGRGIAVSRSAPGGNSAPAWSPDGRRLAYPSSRGSQNLRDRDELLAGDAKGEIWRIPLDGRPTRHATAPPGWQRDLRVHPDGRRLAFSAGQTRSEVWMLELAGR